jgi:hypothetical protein
MATTISGPFPSQATPPSGLSRGNGGFWRQFFLRAFDPYRPELHYMRGPGPACRAKQMALSPAVRTMVAEIRASRALKTAL